MKNMMKRMYLVIGLLAGLVGASYSLPATAASSATEGVPESNIFVYVIVVSDDYEVYWVEVGNAVDPTGNESLAAAANDTLFDR